MTARATRNLAQFIRGQIAHLAAIKFAQTRKGHVLDIQIKPHANGIRSHQKFNIAVLI